MDESLKSFLGDFYYRNAYLQAPNRLHNILGADYDNASEAQQQVMNQVYAQLNSLNSNDRQAQRYNRGLDGEVQNWAQGTSL